MRVWPMKGCKDWSKAKLQHMPRLHSLKRVLHLCEKDAEMFYEETKQGSSTEPFRLCFICKEHLISSSQERDMCKPLGIS